ncbi:FAD-dependent oxidoreductase [Candidatus Uhrbacteria bacterium]|nr:FAD-dependent oxidoreductase [Candidatus Uhrbacteria bacterium]
MDKENIFDLISIGSGAAGLSAAVYAGRYRMRVLVFGADFGGYTSIAGPIENYPGYKEIDGFDLMLKMKEQAEALGTTIKDEKVVRVERQDGCFVVTTEKGDAYSAGTILFATGSEHRKLGLPNETELTSRGVHYCATCDGPAYAGKTVAMVGGGDGSVKGANLTAEYAAKIYIIVRGQEVRAEPINYEEMKKLIDAGKIELIMENEVAQIVGTNKLEKIVLKKEYKGSTDLIIDGLFIEIGAVPRSELAKGLGVALDERGHIIATPMMVTNVPGVFAAGDITPLFGGFKQDITAAAMGAVAATSAYQYYKTNGNLCQTHWKVSGEKT